ncbi:hypothetical protein B14911_07428 [Bacillus sp. NRRL B-14911]|nr:hypothetical protein B14911_07428 [Bacillus sp. NRRL B-14911]
MLFLHNWSFKPYSFIIGTGRYFRKNVFWHVIHHLFKTGGKEMRYILLLLIVIPAAEIGVLLLSGKVIGVWLTILLIICTGLLGAYLAKKQGLETIRRVQEQLGRGQLPGDAVLDGICILVGGTLLLTPGFITDITGFLLLLPPSRIFFKNILMKIFRSRIQRGNIKIIR